MLGKFIQPELRALIAQRDFATLREIFDDMLVPDVAEVVSDIPEEDQAVIFRILPAHIASETFEYLSLATKQSLLRALGQEEVAAILNDMRPDDRTAFLEELPGTVVKDVIQLLTPEERRVALTLLGYPEGSVGRLMTPEYIAVHSDWTVQQALDHVREDGKDSETLNLIYVVDEKGKLIDDVRIREFLLSLLDRTVADLMDENYTALQATDDQGIGGRHFFKVQPRCASCC